MQKNGARILRGGRRRLMGKWLNESGVKEGSCAMLKGLFVRLRRSGKPVNQGTREHPHDCYSCRHARQKRIAPPCCGCRALDDYTFTNWEAR